MNTYSYLYETKATGFLDIENCGNTAIRALNDFYQEKYLIIQTIQGFSKVLQFGPVFVDSAQCPKFVSYTFEEMEFNQYRMDKLIDKFLNDPKFGTTQAIEIEVEEALDKVFDLKRFLE